jgi:hypothetical protein
MHPMRRQLPPLSPHAFHAYQIFLTFPWRRDLPPLIKSGGQITQIKPFAFTQIVRSWDPSPATRCSVTYVIMHKYFVKKIKNVKNEHISFYIQLNMFPCMKISFTFCQHLGPQILSLMNRKNQLNGKKIKSFCF